MIKFTACLATLVMFAGVSAQNAIPEEKPFNKRFFIGLNYSYLRADLELLSMTKKSIWAGQDFGTLEADQEEIDTLNTFVDYGELIHEGILSAGVVLLDKPGKPWFLNGMVSVGFGKREHSVFNKDKDATEISYTSEIYSPAIGIGLNAKYKFSEKWRLDLQAHSVYLFGTTDEVKDDLYPVVGSLSESRKNTFDLSYSRFNLMAGYTVKDFTFMLGPGFYLLYNWNSYKITRTNPADGSTYEDTIDTKLRTNNYLNISARIDWRFSDRFTIYAGTGISSDITVSAGVLFFL